MAQSGFTPIQIYYSTTSGNTPLAANLANGELAINTNDGILYYKDSGGVVQVLASGSSVSVSAALVATTASITLSGAQTIDGVAVVAGNRVLVKDQSTSQNNGLYVASAGAWTRSIDANSSAEIAGRIITVQSGTANGGKQFATTFKSTDTLGTTGMSWFQVALQNTSVAFSTVDTTNLEVTNIKAKDGTANITLADTTGIATFSKATVISTTDNTNAALRITQLGTGNALLVEDTTNPDSTPFVIDANGNTSAGALTATAKLDVNGTVLVSGSASFALSTVVITGIAGQFSCAASTTPLYVGQQLTISGTLGGTGSITGYTNPTTYIVSATNNSTTFTLVTTAGVAIVTTAGTPTGLTYTVNSAALQINGANGIWTTQASFLITPTSTTLDIASTNALARTINIASASTAASTLTFGGANTTGTHTIKIGSGSGGTALFDAGNVASIGTLFSTPTTGAINIATGNTTGAITIGTASTRNLTVGGGTAAANTQNLFSGTNTANQTMNILSGSGDFTKTINIGTGSTLAAGQVTLTVGGNNTTGTNTIRIGGGTGGTATYDVVGTVTTARLFPTTTTGAINIAAGQTSGNLAVMGAQTSGTFTLGGTASTGLITIGQSSGAQTISIGNGANTSATKTINIGTGSTGSGVTSISIGPSDATAQGNNQDFLNLVGPWTAKSALQGENGFKVNNSPTGAFVAPASVNIIAYTSANNAGTYTSPYLAGYINWTDTNTNVTGEAEFFIKTRVSNGFSSNTRYSFYHKPTLDKMAVGTGGSFYSTLNLGQSSIAIGSGALSDIGVATISPTPTTYSVAVGDRAGATSVGNILTSLGDNNVYVGRSAGFVNDNPFLGGYVSILNGENVFVGLNAGATEFTGTTFVSGDGRSVCIGPYAGTASFSSSTTHGGYNTLVGYSAGKYPAAGFNNCTFIGANAGSALVSAAVTYDAVILGGYTGALGLVDGAVIISNGLGDVLFSANSASASLVKYDSITLNNNLATQLRSTAGISFYDSEFKIVDNTDPTKIAAFDAATIGTGTTRTFIFPNANGTLALTSSTQTFSGATTFSNTFTLSGTTTNTSLNAGQTSGTIVIGGTTATGAITVGQSTGAQTLNLGTGATTAATTKAINIGTAGVSTSVTNITLGSSVAGALGTIQLNQPVVVAAGSATLSPLKMTSGVINTTPVAGVVEYDGNVFYGTADATSGRGLLPTIQYFRLTADGTAAGPAIANFFGATSGITLDISAFYEVEYNVYFTKTTAGTVTFTLTYANAPINCNANYVGTPVGGVGTVGAPQTAALAKSVAAASALPVTGSLTTAVSHQYTVKAIFQANATTGGTLNLQVTSSAGTVTPLTGSYYKITRLPALNSGAFI